MNKVRPRTLARNTLRQIGRVKVRTRGTGTTRQDARQMAREQAHALAGGVVIDRGGVMNAPVANGFTAARSAYATRIEVARADHPVRLATAKAEVATARKFMLRSREVFDAALDFATRKDARVMYRHEMRRLIRAEAAVKRIEAEGEDLPSVPKPRLAPQPYEVTYVQPPTNVTYPAIRTSDRRRSAGVRAMLRTPAVTLDTGTGSADVATRGVFAAVARSATRRAKMDD